MQSRMDRYNKINNDNTNLSSRTQKNQQLYEKIKTSDIKGYDVNNNMSLIKDNIKTVDINKVHNFLDERYGESTVKRRRIDIPEISQTQEIDPIMDTKEFDINAIIEKAKQGKNTDYSKERLKKVRETQYEILNNLDDLNKISTVDKAKEKRKEQEENLKHLINTITEIELQNKFKDTTSDLELLSDLMDDNSDDDTKDAIINLETINITEELKDLPEEEKKEEEKVEEDTKELTDTTPDIVIGGVQQAQDTINNKIIRDQRTIDTNDKKIDKPEHIEETLSKLDIDLSNYDDFSDINERDKSSTVLRAVIFVVFVVLILGVLVILNNLLGLGLLPF